MTFRFLDGVSFGNVAILVIVQVKHVLDQGLPHTSLFFVVHLAGFNCDLLGYATPQQECQVVLVGHLGDLRDALGCLGARLATPTDLSYRLILLDQLVTLRLFIIFVWVILRHLLCCGFYHGQ